MGTRKKLKKMVRKVTDRAPFFGITEMIIGIIIGLIIINIIG